MRALYDNFFSRFGLPRQLHSDQGKNFESRIFHEPCLLAGIQKSKTTPFHPQSDGQTERMNRTLIQMLRVTIQSDPENWPAKLPTVMSAYRMTVHKVTGVTPNQAMFGREVLLPATLIPRPPEEPINPTVPFVRDLRNHIRSAHQQVRNATQAVAKTQKTYYDRQVKGPPFAVGQLVWLHWPRPPLGQKIRKLQQVWKIVSFQTDVVVHLQHTQKHSKQTLHIDCLSPCEAAVENSSFGTPPEVADSCDPDVATRRPMSPFRTPPLDVRCFHFRFPSFPMDSYFYT